MRLNSAEMAYPAWLAPSVPPVRVRGNARGGRPIAPVGVSLSAVARRRVALGLTQSEVAERLGVARESLSRLENRPAYRSRRDARVVRFKDRVNALYRALERVRVAA